MTTTARQYALALYQAITEVSDQEQDKVLDNFVSALRKNNDLGMLDEVEKEFVNYDREAKGVKLAVVTTARQLSREEERDLIKGLNKHVSGKVELKQKVDEGLVGGIMIRIDDELMDGSVKKKLKDLKSKLTN